MAEENAKRKIYEKEHNVPPGFLDCWEMRRIQIFEHFKNSICYKERNLEVGFKPVYGIIDEEEVHMERSLLHQSRLPPFRVGTIAYIKKVSMELTLQSIVERLPCREVLVVAHKCGTEVTLEFTTPTLSHTAQGLQEGILKNSTMDFF